LRRIVTSLARLIPNRAKEILIGSPSNPSRIAHLIHGVLNRLPGEAFPCLPCHGLLEGYRMKVDWSRFRAFIYGNWEPEVTKAMTEVVHEGDVAIDIGAHLGYYALILSKIVGPTGRVIAFEPMPENYQVLSENIEMNRCKNVQIKNMAVSNRSGRCEGIPPAKTNSGTFSLITQESSNTIEVNATSLDEYLSNWNRPINFIQMDVEGAEGMVVEGARKTIEAYYPVLLVEVHHFDSSLEASPFPGQLMELGYDLTWLSKCDITSHVLATWNGRKKSGRSQASLRVCGEKIADSRHNE